MIHQYKLNGYNIVLDINSGSVHVVDELAYGVVEKKYIPAATLKLFDQKPIMLPAWDPLFAPEE